MQIFSFSSQIAVDRKRVDPLLRRQAFTLVELSIVLVILGLLTGGILTGQSLIRAAELRSITIEIQRYQTAVESFKDRYMALPGDMRNATQFWQRLNGTASCVTNSAAAISTSGVCDGDGDGTIEWGVAANQSSERHQFWRQLALAGLIEGSFTGVAGSGGQYHSPLGQNIPGSRFPNAGWLAESLGTFAGDARTYERSYGNNLFFGRAVPGFHPYERALTPEDMWNIDMKLDDGKPAQGNIVAMYYNNECAAADDGNHVDNNLVASYVLTTTSVQCAFKVANAF